VSDNRPAFHLHAPVPHLDRFKRAQADPHAGFDAALAEIRAGSKQGHWIWYVFPQLSGLGMSRLSRDYAITDVAEAIEYLRDPLLRSRLLTIASAVAEQVHAGVCVEDLMNAAIDAQKLVSSLTLFGHVARAMNAADPNEECRLLAGVADEILAAAESEGYSRCRYTLARLSNSDERPSS
jgi:uncharacterized protein (DUF1810 family)